MYYFHREALLPCDTQLEVSEDELASDSEDLSILQDRLAERFVSMKKTVAPQVLHNIETAQARQKEYYDRRINPQKVCLNLSMA